jgi:hypothetical protein
MKFLRNYSLSIVLFILFLGSWVGQYYFQYEEFVQNQEQHGQQANQSEFISEFLAATLENWQSEFLQLFSMVVLTAFLYHKGSHESKDQDEKTEKSLMRIEKALKIKNSA